MAGQVSGLIAVQRSGEPGYDDAEFWIRGISTFASNSSASTPLVLVDGVPRKITDIEPDEIETFSVLKMLPQLLFMVLKEQMALY